MWKFVTRGIRESLERRACRTNVYSQSSQDGGSGGNENNKVALCNRKFLAPTFSAFYHGSCDKSKHLGAKDKESNNKYDAKYTWSDAVGWSSVLAVGYVVCQSLCIRRKLFEIDNANLEKWRNKLFINPQIQATRLLSHLLLPRPKYILPVSKQPTEPKDATEILVDNASSVEQHIDLPYGPITAQEALKEAVNEFSYTHEMVMGEIELNFGSKAIEEKRYEDAVEHFIAGAKCSSPSSMFNLALCYELGLGTTLDYTKALKYYTKAADKGHPDAMYNLGVFHAQGKGGLKRNLDTARQLFTEAAKKGQVQALKALQIERSFKKRPNLEQNTRYRIEVKNITNNIEKKVGSKLTNYSNILMSDLNDQTIESDQLINSYDKSINSKNPTEMFLDILGVHERSAIPLLSVGESGP